MSKPIGMPHSEDRERALLGCLIHDGNILGRVELSPSDFYVENHGHIFRAIQSAAKHGRVDVVSVGEALQSFGLLESCGGMGALSEIAEECATTVGTDYYLGVVKGHAKRRAIIRAATDIASEGYDLDRDLSEYEALAETRMLAATQSSAKDTTRTLGDAVTSVWREVQARSAGGAPRGIDIGIQPLQNITGRWLPGQVIVVGASTGAGKSALALNIAEHVAETAGPVAIFSCEMTAEDLAERSISGRSGLPSGDIADKVLDDVQKGYVFEACSSLEGLPIVIEDDASRINTTHIGAVCRRMLVRGGLRLVVVDYLQLMETADHRIPREQQVAQMSRALNRLAKSLRVPFLVLSQLNRASESRDRPTKSDLRESGAIEHDAHKIILLWTEPPEKGQKHGDIRKVEAIVDKNRKGRLGTAILQFNAKLTKFSDWTQKAEAAVWTL